MILMKFKIVIFNDGEQIQFPIDGEWEEKYFNYGKLEVYGKDETPILGGEGPETDDKEGFPSSMGASFSHEFRKGMA